MIILYLILLIIIVILILLFTKYLKVRVVFDTCKTDLNMTLLWLHTFLKAWVTIEDTKPMLTIYLLNKRLFKRRLIKEKKNLSGVDIIKLIDTREIQVNTYYGFRDPFITGITCGVINAASQFINIDFINQRPDFNTESDYIYLDASAKINLGSSLINYLSSKLRHKSKNY